MPANLSRSLRAAYEAKTAGRKDRPALDIQWGYAEIAAYLDVSEETVRTYRKRASRNVSVGASKPGDLPEPDRRVVGTRGLLWNPETIIRWDLEERPGQGVGGGRPWHKD